MQVNLSFALRVAHHRTPHLALGLSSRGLLWRLVGPLLRDFLLLDPFCDTQKLEKNNQAYFLPNYTIHF